MALKHEFPAEQFVPARVGRTYKLGEDLEMRLLDADRAVGSLTILQHEEVSKKGLWAFQIRSLSEGCPQVKGSPHRFFRPIVEVVTEGGADLRFGFNGGDQRPIANDQEVSFFGRPEEAGQLYALLSENAPLRNTGLYD